MRVANILLYAKDLNTLATFYTEILGLPIVEGSRTDVWLELATGSVNLGLHAIPTQIAETISITAPPEPREESPVKLIFQTEDLPAIRTKLEAFGLLLRTYDWGAIDAMDPEGNIFQLQH